MSDLVWGFFYGGLINPGVMKRVGLRPKRQLVATLSGFEIEIAPLVNLVRRPMGTVYGLLMEVPHPELADVYRQLKAIYLPFPVAAADLEGRFCPALCYIVPDMPRAQADAAHIAPLLESAAALHFPDWYIERIRSFLPA